MENEKIEKFLIKNPLWTFIVSIILVVIGGAASVALTVFLCLNLLHLVFIVVDCLSAIFALFGCFGIYANIKEKFIFENETFTYVKVLKKAQSARLEDIDKVEIDYSLLIKVRVCDSQGKILLSFLDDGTVFSDGNFIKVLKQRNVKVIESGKNWLAYKLS